MLSPLPDMVDPLRLCDQGSLYQGSIALAELPRLVSLLCEHESAEVAYTVVLDRDAQRRPRVQVRVRADLSLRCQRCLCAVEQSVDSESVLVVVSGLDEAGRLDDDVDPWLIEDGRGDLRALIEDELLLAIPAVPMHPAAVCGQRPERAAGPVGCETPDGRTNPFAALSGWKDDRTKQD